MEILITTDDSDSKSSINLWNALSGTKLLGLRGPPAQTKTLTMGKDEMFAVGEVDKPFIHVWQSGQNLQTSKRILCPGKPGSVVFSPCSNYIVMSIEEKINIWQIGTGRIVKAILSAHYRPVTVLKFNDDGTYLISGGQDGQALAWDFLSILAIHNTSSPKYSWAHHTLPISDIHVGSGGRKARIFTCSADRTAKIYSLWNGGLLLSVSYPLPLTTITTDDAELSFFVGATNGAIYQMKLFTPPRSIEHHISSDVYADLVLKKGESPITVLAVSLDGNRIASGDETGQVQIWDLEGKQVIKTFSVAGAAKARITNLMFWIGNPENFKVKTPSVQFPENPKLIEITEVENNPMISVFNINRQQKEDPFDERLVKKMKTESESKSAEISKLNIEIAKYSDTNKNLFEFCVTKLLGKTNK